MKDIIGSSVDQIVLYPESPDPTFRLVSSGRSKATDRSYFQRRNYRYTTFEYILQGKGTLLADGQEYDLHTGDVYLLHKGEDHAYYSDRKEPWEKVFIILKGILVENLLATYGLLGTHIVPTFAQPGLFFTFHNLRHYSKAHPVKRPSRKNRQSNFFQSGPPADDKTTENKGQTISRSSGGQVPLIVSPPTGEQTPQTLTSQALHKRAAHCVLDLVQALSEHLSPLTQIPPQIRRIGEYIESMQTANINLEHLCRRFGKSKSALIIQFKKYYGTTPYDYLMSKKIEAAKVQLVHSHKKIKEIAAEYCFADEYYFSNYFKKKVHMSPRDYRNKYD